MYISGIWLLVGLVMSLESSQKETSAVLLCVRISVTSQAQLATIASSYFVMISTHRMRYAHEVFGILVWGECYDWFICVIKAMHTPFVRRKIAAFDVQRALGPAYVALASRQN